MSEVVNIGPGSEDWPDRAEHLTEGFSVVVDLKVGDLGGALDVLDQLGALRGAQVEAQVELDVKRRVPSQKLTLVFLLQLGKLTEKVERCCHY